MFISTAITSSNSDGAIKQLINEAIARDLPISITRRIFGFLSLEDYNSASCVSTNWHRLATYTAPDWTQRPKAIEKRISDVFNTICRDYSSKWGMYNGDYRYNLCRIDEKALIAQTIEEMPQARRDFYFLDIGAGEYQLGDGVATFINEKFAHVREDMRFHIIGVRGESNERPSVTHHGRCTLYKLGGFKIEELSTEFKKHGLAIANKVDIVVSRWCFRHFVDPVGTFAQTFNLLRPKTGILLMDGFFFQHEREKVVTNVDMLALLVNTEAPFLMYPYTSDTAFYPFILRRPDAVPCQLAMDYLGLKPLGFASRYDIRSECFTVFQAKLNVAAIKWHEQSMEGYTGDQALFNTLKKQKLIPIGSRWAPVNRTAKTIYPLHQSVIAGKLKIVEDQLNRLDIDDSDALGNTPLSLSVQHQHRAIFKLLVNRNARVDLTDDNGKTALHHAASRHNRRIC